MDGGRSSPKSPKWKYAFLRALLAPRTSHGRVMRQSPRGEKVFRPITMTALLVSLLSSAITVPY
jgi:hypothetical protein